MDALPRTSSTPDNSPATRCRPENSFAPAPASLAPTRHSPSKPAPVHGPYTPQYLDMILNMLEKVQVGQYSYYMVPLSRSLNRNIDHLRMGFLQWFATTEFTQALGREFLWTAGAYRQSPYFWEYPELARLDTGAPAVICRYCRQTLQHPAVDYGVSVSTHNNSLAHRNRRAQKITSYSLGMQRAGMVYPNTYFRAMEAMFSGLF